MPTQSILDQLEAAGATPARTNAGNDGRAFQKELEVTAGGYLNRRVARLQKVDPPVAIIWPRDKLTGRPTQRVIFKANPWLDFSGCWIAKSGLMLLVEVKSSSTHRLPLRDGHLSMEQRASIRNWRLCRAAACVLWKFNDRVTLWTPEMLAAADARADKSLVFEGNLVWDFLPVLERALWPTKSAPARVEVVYRGRAIYRGNGVWFCDDLGEGGFLTIEKALEAVDVRLGKPPEIAT